MGFIIVFRYGTHGVSTLEVLTKKLEVTTKYCRRGKATALRVGYKASYGNRVSRFPTVCLLAKVRAILAYIHLRLLDFILTREGAPRESTACVNFHVLPPARVFEPIGPPPEPLDRAPHLQPNAPNFVA